jgi:hypothetical protein
MLLEGNLVKTHRGSALLSGLGVLLGLSLPLGCIGVSQDQAGAAQSSSPNLVATATISTSERATPTAEPTPTAEVSPSQRLRNTDILGGEITHVLYSRMSKILTVDFDIQDALTENGVRDSAKFGTLEIVRAAMESGIPFEELDIGGYFEMVDSKGRTSRQQVLKMFFSRQSLAEVEDFGPHMRKYVYSWADIHAYLHPAFRDRK